MLLYDFTATDLLSAAAGEVGTVEEPPGSNRIKYNAWAGLQGEPWCVTFWRWLIVVELGGSAPFDAYNPDVKAWAQGLGIWHPPTEMPQVGDLVQYAFPNDGSTPNHIGGVETVYGIRDIGTIEGNTDDAGGRTGGKVMRKHRTSADYIDGYIRPTYKAAGAVEIGDDMPYMLMCSTDFQYQTVQFKAGYTILVVGNCRYHVAGEAELKTLQADGIPVKGAGPLQLTVVLDRTSEDIHRFFGGK